MKFVLIGLAAAGLTQSQPAAVLRVSVVAWNAPTPLSFAQVEVDTTAGKRIASAFTTAQGNVEFHLPEGIYVVAARSNNVSQCGTQSRGTVTSLCAGSTRVSVAARSEINKASVVIRPPSATRP